MKKFSISLLKITLLLIIVMCLSAFISQVNAAKNESNLTLDYNGGKNVINGAEREVAIDGDNDNVFTMVDYKNKIKKTNCEFLGWSMDKNATEPDPLYSVGKRVVVMNKTTIYAVWQKQVLLLDFNGGHKKGSNITKEYAIDNNDDNTYLIVDYKDKIEKSNCEFLGWSTDKNATEPEPLYSVGKRVVVMNKTTIYAVWKKKANIHVEKPELEPEKPNEEILEIDLGNSIMNFVKRIFEWLAKFLVSIIAMK